MKIAIIGLSLGSSWGNGHATTYRALIKGLRGRGHAVTFFERHEPWYAAHRDFPGDDDLYYYFSADELLHDWCETLVRADLLVIGSYVRDTAAILQGLRGRPRGVLAYYDIDTPVTVAGLKRGTCRYLTRELVPEFDLYLSFSGGGTLEELEGLGARRPRPLYCCADPEVHAPAERDAAVDLGYLGTYSEDRQPAVRELLLTTARLWPEGRFTVAGPQYPDVKEWPSNVTHLPHLPPDRHADFYCSQRFTLNVTRADMRRMGYSPSVRLFEAACCGTPIISDHWAGLDDFFAPGSEILTAGEHNDVLRYVRELPDDERSELGLAARRRVLSAHTGEHRAAELESYYGECAS